MSERKWIIRSAHNPRLFCCPGNTLWWPLDMVSASHAVPAPSAVAMDLPCGGIWSPLSARDQEPVPARIRDAGIDLLVDVGGWARDGAGGSATAGQDSMGAVLAFLERAGNPSLVRAMMSGWVPRPSCRMDLLYPDRLALEEAPREEVTEEDQAPSPSFM